VRTWYDFKRIALIFRNVLQEGQELSSMMASNLLELDKIPEDTQCSFFSVRHGRYTSANALVAAMGIFDLGRSMLILQIFHSEDRDFAMGDVFRTEVWQNPLEIYMSVSEALQGP